MDNRMRRTVPLRQGGSVTAEGCVVNLVEKNAEEGSRFVVRVWLKVGMDLDDECGGDGGEQTSLLPS